MDKRARGGIAADQVTNLLETAARAGADPSDILARAQVPYTMAELSGGAAAGLTRRHLVAIYRECIVTIGWHSSQLDRKPQMHPDEFRLMCYCVISSRDLRDVILRQSMFFRTRGDRLSVIHLTDDGPIARGTMDTLRRRKNFASFLSDLAGVSIFCRFYAWLLGVGLHDFSVELAYDAAYANDALRGFFVGHLGFGAPANSISFPRVLLDQPVVRSPEELDELLVEFPFDFMSARTYEMALPDRIRSIYSFPPWMSWPGWWEPAPARSGDGWAKRGCRSAVSRTAPAATPCWTCCASAVVPSAKRRWRWASAISPASARHSGDGPECRRPAICAPPHRRTGLWRSPTGPDAGTRHV